MLSLVSTRSKHYRSTETSGASKKLRLLLMNKLPDQEINVRVEDTASDRVLSTFNVEVLALVYWYLHDNPDASLEPNTSRDPEIDRIIKDNYDFSKNRNVTEGQVIGTFVLYLKYLLSID